MLQIITQIHTRKTGTNPAKFPRSPDIRRVFDKILCSNHSCSFLHSCIYHWVASPTDGSVGKESAYKLVDGGSSLRLERSPGEGNDNPLQDSCLTEEPDRLQSMGSQRVRHDWVSAKHPFTTEFKGLSKSSPPMQWSHSFGLKSYVTKGQTQLSNWTATTHMASFKSSPSHLYKVHMLQATSKSHGVFQCKRQSISYRWFLKIIWFHILCLYFSVW